MSSSLENDTFFGGDLFVASSFSVLMLVVFHLCTDTEFLMCESESVDVFPMVVKASLALAATFLEENFLYCL